MAGRAHLRAPSALRWVQRSSLTSTRAKVERPGPTYAPLAMLLLRRGVVLARRREQPLAGRGEDDHPRVADVRSVFGLAALDGHDVADLERVARPALAHEAVGAAHLHAPVDDLAVRIGDVHIEVRMWVRPLDLGDGALHVHRLVRVKLRGKGVMRNRGPRREHETNGGSQSRKLHLHATSTQTAILGGSI